MLHNFLASREVGICRKKWRNMREKGHLIEWVKSGVGETKINYSLGGFPASGASPQLDRYSSVLQNLIPFS